MGLSVFAAVSLAHAETTGPTTLVEEVGGKWKGLSLTDLGVNVGSWLNGGITYNADDPTSNFNGPNQFNDRSGELQINQWYAFIDRPVTAGAWDFGFRSDFLFGTDARFTAATGLDDNLIGADERNYKFTIPQLYVSAGLPLPGLSARLGRFYTLIGNEVVPSPSNFFYSHSYTFFYAEPFTHTGLVFDYTLNDHWAFTAGAVIGPDDNGFDNFSQYGSTNFLGGGGWTSTDQDTKVYGALTSGAVGSSDNNRTIASLVINRNFLDTLHGTLQGDYGVQEGALAPGRDSDWYGLIGYLTADVSDTLSTGIRAEYFRDSDGVRLGTPGTGGNLYGITAGVNWKPLKWVTVRPEVRYDFSEGRIRRFDDGAQGEQFTFATDVILHLL